MRMATGSYHTLRKPCQQQRRRAIAVGGAPPEAPLPHPPIELSMSYNSVMVLSRNLAIAAEFHRLADELESQRANPFRVRAYRQPARLIERLSEDAGALARRGDPTPSKGT